jgi:hypothetical protein
VRLWQWQKVEAVLRDVSGGGVILMASEFVSRMKEVAGYIKQARDLMARGPLDFYFAKLVEHSEALLVRFAPLKCGQRAVICKKIKCERGWAGRDRTLAIGATGTIRDVDYADGRFEFTFAPDHEWWTDSDGKEHETGTPHTYCLVEGELSAMADELRDGVLKPVEEGELD